MFVERYIASIDKSHTCRHYYFIGIRYVAPTIINTFLESYDFSGKKIVLFATSGGSGFGKTLQNLEGSCPGAALVEGKVVKAGATKEDLKSWALNL